MAIAANNTFDTARNFAGYSGDGNKQTVSDPLGTLVGAAGVAFKVVSVLRSIGPRPFLDLIALARRNTTMGTLVLLGTGVAVGAGAAILLTPKSGAEMRRTLLKRIKGISGEAKQTIVTAEHKAEEIAGKAKDSVVTAEHKLETKVHDIVDSVVTAEHKLETKVHDIVDSVVTAEHKLETKVHDIVDSVVTAEHKLETKVHDIVDEVKAVLQSSEHYAELRKAGALNGTGNHHSNGKGNHHSNGTSDHHLSSDAARTAVN